MGRFAIILFALFLAACSSSLGQQSIQEETDGSLATKITRGQTTKDQVAATFGAPMTKTITDTGNEQWTYQLNTGSASAVNFIPVVGTLAGSNLHMKSLVILFDRGGKVVNYTLNDSTMRVGGIDSLKPQQ